MTKQDKRENTCDIRCKTAKSNKCQCSCNGENHGIQKQFGEVYECEICGDVVEFEDLEHVVTEAPEDDYADYYIHDVCKNCFKNEFGEHMKQGDQE